jgi:LGFP repeat
MKTASVPHQQVTGLDNEIAYQSKKQLTTSTLDVVVNNQRVMGLDGETAHHLKKELRLTPPALDVFVDSIPLTRLPQLTQTVAGGHFIVPKGSPFLHPDKPVPTLDKMMLLAEQEIGIKAKQLSWVGAAISQIEQVGHGYVVRYEAADIYYSTATGAHEVHGDIRAKYNVFGGANGVLGLPTTDETGTPDGIGRFNHFEDGSIYWTVNTGPMMIRGVIRDMWAAQGWENSTEFGYPVIDYLTTTGNPPEHWNGFQNGGIYSKNDKAAEALYAEITPQDLTGLVRKSFDKTLKAADPNLGIEGGVNVLNVSDWGFGFWESRKRIITYEINGFYSNGVPLVADPTFRLELQFLFALTTFTEHCDSLRATLRDLEAKLRSTDRFLVEAIPGEQHPPKPVVNPAWQELSNRVNSTGFALQACERSNTSAYSTLSKVDKILAVYLPHWRISTSGVGSGKLQDRLVSAIPDKFPIAVTTIPAKALLIDVLVTSQGGLKFLLEPNVDFPGEGVFRSLIFQGQLNSFIES